MELMFEIINETDKDIEELKNIDSLFCSNYVRAISTAKYICSRNNIKLNIDERLNERKIRFFK